MILSGCLFPTHIRRLYKILLKSAWKSTLSRLKRPLYKLYHKKTNIWNYWIVMANKMDNYVIIFRLKKIMIIQLFGPCLKWFHTGPIGQKFTGRICCFHTDNFLSYCPAWNDRFFNFSWWKWWFTCSHFGDNRSWISLKNGIKSNITAKIPRFPAFPAVQIWQYPYCTWSLVSIVLRNSFLFADFWCHPRFCRFLR